MRRAVRDVDRRTRMVLTSVRGRLTVLATTLLAVALALAAAIMLLVLYRTLVSSADAATSARAQEVAAMIASEGIAGLDDSVLAPAENLDVIQIVNPDGTVVASDPRTHTTALIGAVAPDVRRTVDGAQFSGSGDEYRVSALGVAAPDGDVTVVVGTAEGPIHNVLATVAILLCIVFPLILLMLIFVTYYFVGRSLRPVEHIRAEVAAISSGDLSKRVPVPDTHDEISTLATTMNDMLDGLERSHQRQLRFVGDASHELRSPLMTLVGLLDLSRTTRHAIDPDTVEDILLPEAQRLRSMIDDLLLLARADEHGVPLRDEDVDLDDVVSAEVHRLEALTDLRIEVTIVPVRVRGDADMLTRAVRNLADNAARHARSTVQFVMRLDRESNTGHISIIDDGPGIPDADKTRVFDRFVRLDTDRERSRGGSGLGLAIVFEIVRAHSGTIVVGNSPSGGASVTIALPLDPEDA